MTARSSGFPQPRIEQRKVSTPFGSKPGSMRMSATKLRSMSPDPISSTNDSATSATTTPLRSSRPRCRAPACGREARSTSARSGRDARTRARSRRRSAEATAQPDRECEHDRIHRDRLEPRQIRRRQRDEQLDAELSRARARARRRRCQRAADSPRASAGRAATASRPARRAPRARAHVRGADEKEIGDVRAGDEQHEDVTAPMSARIAGRTSATMYSLHRLDVDVHVGRLLRSGSARRGQRRRFGLRCSPARS